MKLVETAGGHDGELPAAETCGMEDDEEDVHFVDHKSTSFLGKIKEKFSKNPMKVCNFLFYFTPVRVCCGCSFVKMICWIV